MKIVHHEMPKWPATTKHERLMDCVKTLYLHDVITHLEYLKLKRKVEKLIKKPKE